MRLRSLVVMVVLVVLVSSIVLAQAPKKDRLNPMIALHEQNLPVFGVTHAAITAGGRGGRRRRTSGRTSSAARYGGRRPRHSGL